VTHEVAVVAGDGIGPEVMAAARLVIDATGAPIAWREAPVGQAAFAETGSALPDSSLATVRACGVVMKGPLVNPTTTSGYPSPNMGLRAEYDMFANVRVCRSLDGGAAGLDVAIIREMTEGILASPGQAVGADAGVHVSAITRSATERIARFACDWALQNDRKTITVAHKASILRFTDGLFLDVVREVVATYPDLQFDEIMVDTAATQLLRRPESFDVVVTGSQYGDILSDVCGGTIGGPGMMPGSTYGTQVAFFETVHGAAPKYAGLDRANPVSMILTGASMLRHVGETSAADAVTRAVSRVVTEGRILTPDLGGASGTRAMADAVAAALDH
jgi:isocitrate dehydrogenase (NAD+)